MNEDTQNAMAALGVTPSPAGTPPGGEVDWKAKYEEMANKYNATRVEEGRVKTLDAQLKAAQSKIAELEKSVALGALPQNLQDVPDDIKETALAISRQTVAGVDARMAQLEQKVEADKNLRLAQMSNEFVARINQQFPAFAKGLKEGGAFKAAWDEYQRYNSESIAGAFARLDADTLAYHIQRFFESKGVDPSGGRETNAAPDPRAMGGGAGSWQAMPGGPKTYTPDEWEKELDGLLDQYESGVLKADDYLAKRQNLMDAYKEGRVRSKGA